MVALLTWPSLAIHNLDRGLRRVVELVENPPKNEPDQVAQALARFLVIRTCGHLEKTVQECLRAYVENKSYGRVRLFSQSWLVKLNNPEPERLIELVDRFDPSLALDLQSLFEANDFELKREISLLINKRNAIAHGENEGIGSRKALDLYRYEQDLADWFVLNFDPR